jgi:hypothetical protein
MKFIFGIIIFLFFCGIVVYLYDNLKTVSLSNDILKNIITENTNLTKKQISDLQNKINIINDDYIKNNDIINKNYSDILTKLAVLNSTNTDNNIVETKNITNLIKSTAVDRQIEYTNKINENNDKIINDITQLINTSITNNNNNLMNELNI